MAKLDSFVAHEVALSVTAEGVMAVRSGARAVLKDSDGKWTLGRLLANRLPYHYRTLEGIVSDFAMGTSALEAAIDLASTAPDSPKFQQSHCGEILAATYIEEVLGYKRLYSKLTLTTSENTNVHKMDGLFVKTSSSPYEYLFIEAKSSILPTDNTKTKTHRSGILRQMLDSLHTYGSDDPRFELARIRDNLSKDFTETERLTIRGDLIPPGPPNLRLLGVSITNVSTINQEDDDFILSEDCSMSFNYRAIVVSNLAELASEAYGYWAKIKAALNV